MVSSTNSAPSLTYLWLPPIATALHEAEEWNILDWYREHWVNVGDLSNQTVWTWLIVQSLVGFLITGFALLFARWPPVTFGIICFGFAFLFLHTLLHAYWVFYFEAYSPGTSTAELLLAPAYIYVCWRGIRERVLPIWLLAIALTANLPPLVFGFQIGNTIPEGGLPWYRLSEQIARVVLGG